MFVKTSLVHACTPQRVVRNSQPCAPSGTAARIVRRPSAVPHSKRSASCVIDVRVSTPLSPAWNHSCQNPTLPALPARAFTTSLCSNVAPRRTPAAGAVMAAVALPASFEAVMGVVAASFFVHHIYMAFSVGHARRKFGVKYPDLYATSENCPKEEDAKAFNCVQRGHQNSLENQPIFLALLVCAGLKHPITAAIAGGVSLIGRVLYFSGYSTGVPNNRLTGSLIALLGTFTLLGTVLKAVFVWGSSLLA